VLPGFGTNLYLIEQRIDTQVDRRAVGSEMRYFKDGLSVTGQLDYDLMLRGLNIASFQSTLQRADNTVFNLLFDRRTTPLLSLGNALFFVDPTALTQPTRISDILNTSTLDTLRQQIRATTAMATQATAGVTTPNNERWQIGGDLRYTNVGALAPVVGILPAGQPSTGNLWSYGGQLIGSNLYSTRDTHVILLNYLTGPTFRGQLLSYNNSSQLTPELTMEPSLKLYRQTETTGTHTERVSPSLRATYRRWQRFTVESEMGWERSQVNGPTRNEASRRLYYYVGSRLDF
jgi:hypothetical protein